MGTHFLADTTNAGIDFLSGKLPAASAAWFQQAIEERRVYLSVVSRIELLSWTGSPADMQLLTDFIAATTVLALDEPVIQTIIQLRQQHKAKLPDAIIAATAVVHTLPILTRNTGDFKAFVGLIILNPHEPTQLLTG